MRAREARTTEMGHNSRGAISSRHPELAEIERTLSREITPQTIRDALAAAVGALQATRTVVTKGGAVESPDYATRLRAVEILLSWGVGKPVERSLIVQRTESDTMGVDKLRELAQQSPAMRAALVELLSDLTALPAEAKVG